MLSSVFNDNNQDELLIVLSETRWEDKYTRTDTQTEKKICENIRFLNGNRTPNRRCLGAPHAFAPLHHSPPCQKFLVVKCIDRYIAHLTEIKVTKA